MSEPISFGRPFVLQRDRDISGVSGTGIIADGVLFPDGHAAIHWRGKWALTTPHPDGMDSIMGIHDHGGQGDLHVIWADQDEQRREFAADVAEAFDVPGWVAGPEAERVVLRRQLARALTAEHERQASEQVVASPEEHCAGFADAAMTVVDEVLGQRDRWRHAAGRAYRLAYRWQGAHGASIFLVRTAGVELRDALDESGDMPAGIVHSVLNGQVSGVPGVDYMAAECAAQYHPGDPFVERVRLCIRAAQHRGDHIDEVGFHWSDTVAVYPAAEPEHSRPASNCSNPDHACGTCRECHEARTNRPGQHGYLLPHQVREHHPGVRVTVRLDNSAAKFTPRQQAYKAVSEYLLTLRCTSLATRTHIWRAVNRALDAAGHAAAPAAQRPLPHEMEG